MKEWIQKARGLPLQQKQYILWGAVGLIGLVLLVWWVQASVNRWQEISRTREEIEQPKKEIWPEMDSYWSGWDLESLFPPELGETLKEGLEEIEQEDEQRREED